MIPETVPTYRRVYVVIEPGSPGKMRLRGSITPPEIGAGVMMVLISRGQVPSMGPVEVELIADPALAGGEPQPGPAGDSAYQIARDHGYGGTETQWLASLVGAPGPQGPQGGTGATGPQGAAGAPGKNASALLGTVSITQTATIALSAGVRQITVPVPAAHGMKAGDPVLVIPTAHVTGYAVHNAVAVSDTSLVVAITAPLLAIGASFTIPARLFRLT